MTSTAASAPATASATVGTCVMPSTPVGRRDGVPGTHVGAFGEQPSGQHEARRLAHVVGVRLEGETEERDRRASQLAELLLELSDQPALLQLVDLDHGGQQLEVIAGVGGQLLERERVLRKARAAVADSGPEEARADTAVEADALGHAHDVGARRLADVGDLVDERDPRHQGCVRRELDHLRRCDVAADDGRLDPVVQRGDTIAVGVVDGADHDPVGMQEVPHRSALRGELRVGDVADVLETTLVEPVPHLLPRPHRHRALHHDDDAAVDLRQLVDHRPDRRQVGIAGVGRRRADGHEDDVRAVDGLGDVRREREALTVAGDDLLQARLVDRHFAATECVDAGDQDVAKHHLVAELREARAGDETDVSGAEDNDALSRPAHRERRIRERRARPLLLRGAAEIEQTVQLPQHAARDHVATRPLEVHAVGRAHLDEAAGRPLEVLGVAATRPGERPVRVDVRHLPRPLARLLRSPRR